MKTILLPTALSIGLSTLLIMSAGAQSKTAKQEIKMYEADRANFEKVVTNTKTINEHIRASYGCVPNYERKYNAKNELCSADEYTTPKNVALLTYYIEDSEYKSYSSDFWNTYRVSTKSTSAKVNAVAQFIYDEGIEELKKQYAALGMNLQTPDEYLTTPELKAAYTAELPNLESRLGIFDLLGSGTATPEGYRMLPYNSVLGMQGKQFYKERMDFFQSLGFDAMVIVAIKLTAANDAISGVTSSFLFKNPGWDASGLDGMIVGYAPYSEAIMTMKFDPELKGIFIKKQEDITNKKGKPDVELVIEAVDPALAMLVNVTTEGVAKKAVVDIKGKEKKKKK